MNTLKGILGILGIVILCLSCKKTDDIGSGVDLPIREEFSIAAGLTPFVVHHFYFENVPTHFNQILGGSGKTIADVRRILTTQGNLGAIFNDVDFNFFEEVSVRLYPASRPNDYIETAYRLPVPLDNGPNLGLIPSLADVKNLVSEERINIDLALRLRSTTTEEIPTRLDLIFRVEL